MTVPEPDVSAGRGEDPMVVRVMVVDDDDLALSALVSVVEFLGADVTGLSSVAAATDHVRSGADVDAVITDLRLDGSSTEHGGSQLSRWLSVHRPGLPVLVLTGDPGAIGTIPGARQVLRKPIRLQALKKALHQVLPGSFAD